MLAYQHPTGALGRSAHRHVVQPHSLASSSRRSHVGHSRRSVGMAVAASPAELQQLLDQKERELAAMFESGRPMPAASVVAAVRSEIATLEAQLGGRPAPAPFASPAPTGGPPRGPPSFGGGPQPPRMPASANMSPGPVRSRTEQLADKAYDMIEQQMRGNPGKGQEDDAEVARLEHENTQLRAEAYALLQRQQQLEAMLAEVNGQKEPELLLESAESLLARMKAKLQKS